ncbi:hypothetical protein D7V54_22725 [Escherichia coli]|nr:hypothetical protein [Escherichia coli]EEV5791821.1 hypothetical protein [Escherichia coli]EEV6211644.1 hypothetical protein [Escherichia coli]EEV8731735.1 hypothetical protein [Escherichia coli]EEW0654506.1 hypothetical protein [Escherichia coli]
MFNRYGGGLFCYLLVFAVMAQEVFDEPSVRCSVLTELKNLGLQNIRLIGLKTVYQTIRP